MGKGLGVLAFDAIGDGFELLGHVAHVVVVAARDHAGPLDVASGEQPCCQNDQRHFESPPDEAGSRDGPHAVTPLNSTTQTHGFASHAPLPLM